MNKKIGRKKRIDIDDNNIVTTNNSKLFCAFFADEENKQGTLHRWVSDGWSSNGHDGNDDDDDWPLKRCRNLALT